MNLKVTDLNNIELSRILLQRLGGHYSTGGISCGRSINSFILDLILPLLPKTELSDSDITNFDQAPEHSFLIEAERRVRHQTTTRDLQLGFDDLELLSNTDLVKQLLVHLNQYQLFGYDSPLIFRDFVNLVVLIWPPSTQEKLFEREEVTNEARDREWYRFSYKNHNLCEYYPDVFNLEDYEKNSEILKLLSDEIP